VTFLETKGKIYLKKSNASPSIVLVI